MSTTFTSSYTFTITNARYLSSKVAADMHVCSVFYGHPAEADIRKYAEELAVLLRDGYVSEYEFGYKRNAARVVCWQYSVSQDGSISLDDTPGKVISFADTSGATYYNFLTYSDKWWNSLNDSQRDDIRKQLPIQRTPGSLPGNGAGYWVCDKQYSSNGVGLARRTFRPSA